MSEQEELTAEKKKEILDYCNAHPNEDWASISQRFQVPAKVVSNLYFDSLF